MKRILLMLCFLTGILPTAAHATLTTATLPDFQGPHDVAERHPLRIRVIAIDQSTDDHAAKANPAKPVTLEVTAKDAENAGCQRQQADSIKYNSEHRHRKYWQKEKRVKCRNTDSNRAEKCEEPCVLAQSTV